MVPRIEITRPSKSESPEDDVWRRGPWQQMSKADGVSRQPDWDEDGKRYSQESMVDELESSVSGMSSDQDGKTSWEERMKWWKVYALHFLFMWNSRTFEYVSVKHPQVFVRFRTDWLDISCCFSFS